MRFLLLVPSEVLRIYAGSVMIRSCVCCLWQMLPLCLVASCTTHQATALPTPQSGPRFPVAVSPSSPPPTGSETPAPHVSYPSTCPSASVRLSLGPLVSEATGQHTTMLRLTNVGPRGCHLIGYPRVTLSDSRGALLPFVYIDGGNQMLTHHKPVQVDIAPGAHGYFAIDQYRCDTSQGTAATAMNVTLPSDRSALRLAFDGRVAYCGNGDPGSTVYISPIASTEQAILNSGR